MEEPRAPLTVFFVQLIFQTTNVNFSPEADEPIAGPEGITALLALGVAEALGVEDEEGGVDELAEPPAALITLRTMSTTTIFCQVFSERNFSQIFFKKPICCSLACGLRLKGGGIAKWKESMLR